MFKIGSFESELFENMDKQLKTEDSISSSKISKAVDYLSAASLIFRNFGMSKEADELDEIIKISESE